MKGNHMKYHRVVRWAPCLDHEINLTEFTSKESMRNLYKDNYTESMWNILVNHYKNLTK